jgi:hypothetical protein
VHPAATARRAGPNLWLSIAILVCGVLLGMPAIYKVVTTIVRTVVSPATVHVPGETRLHLTPGRYLLFQRTGTTTGGGGITFTQDRGVNLPPSAVSVTETNGEGLDVGLPGATETITRGGRKYTGAVEFRVPNADDYVIRVDAPAQDDVLVARSIGETFRSLLPWIGLGVLAFLVIATGVTLLIVGEVRRHRQARVPPPYWAQPTWPPPPPYRGQ